jgi:hypothetical protein
MDATWVLGGLIGVLLTAWTIDQARQRCAPRIQLTARIVATRTAVNEGSGWESPSRFLVTFRDEAGHEREMRVSESLFQQLAPGQSGTLTLRGEQVMAFDTA